MEKLKARLDELQEEILSYIENDSTDLQEQIKHWNALRRDYVTQYYARSKGLTTVGMHPILPLAVCKEKAKKAIEMSMVLTSLQQSAFAQEPWTLSDTSQELWKAPPELCLKKHGSTVRVIFDGDAKNEMQYTNWERIYYETAEGWHMTSGHVEHKGIYYWRDCCKRYFVDFSKEADKYGKQGVWEVIYQNVTFSPVDSVSSTTECDGERECEREHQHWRPEEEGRDVDWRQTEPLCERRADRHGQRQRQRRKRDLSPSAATNQRPPRRQRPPPEEGEEGQVAAEPDGEEQVRQVAAQEEAHLGGLGPGPEGLGQAPRNRRPPVHLPVNPAADIPILFLHGPPNSLKCYRYRVLRNYSGLLLNISKCWSWVRGEQHEARVTVAFNNTAQRQQFLQTVPFPPNISYSWGRISSL
ncbi:putative regulatory protein E2 [Ovis aries papillomavirus 3]|uniref:Regulatory protein E2 n=1 Tax=Ovis aries papillomavirus 3 TaxID=634772 RepID=D5FL28_9PAPI|nr:putative regulatory protein E2 [Ovis aries papillomavirus 3]ACO58659.1 putative regulatory protein E2 [Ovis aries papillomavirus 3]